MQVGIVSFGKGLLSTIISFSFYFHSIKYILLSVIWFAQAAPEASPVFMFESKTICLGLRTTQNNADNLPTESSVAFAIRDSFDRPTDTRD
jgi:hypothetical protein